VSLWVVHHGDNADVLPTIADESIDAIVTDPPAGIAFMGKAWDRATRQTFVVTMTATFTECLRVMKPGAHALVWAFPVHRHRARGRPRRGSPGSMRAGGTRPTRGAERASPLFGRLGT
jgi:site-specific DNA-methyltransferase (adenine-specific)